MLGRCLWNLFGLAFPTDSPVCSLRTTRSHDLFLLICASSVHHHTCRAYILVTLSNQGTVAFRCRSHTLNHSVRSSLFRNYRVQNLDKDGSNLAKMRYSH